MTEAGLAEGAGVVLGEQGGSNGDDESDEGEQGADRQEGHREHQAEQGADARQDEHPTITTMGVVQVAAETRVALELLFDLAEDPLFVFRERHGVLLSVAWAHHRRIRCR